MKIINVMVVDDHSLMRQGLCKILELEDDIKIIGEAKDGLEAIDIFKRTNIDVILLDINMPNMNGIDTLRKLKDMDSTIKVIMLTVYDDREYLVETLNLGANGYMLKDSDSENLVNAIRKVYSGEIFIQTEMNLDNLNLRSDKKINTKEIAYNLTKREYEVLCSIAEGLSNKDISKRLCISEKTVKNHVSSILKKLDLSDRTQAAIYAYKNNIKKI